MWTRLALIVWTCFTVFAQTPKAVFEAASVKAATPLGPAGLRADRRGGPGTTDPGTYTCNNCPVSWVVSEAYQLLPFELAGPDWLENVRFDFAAKIPPGTTKEAFREMLQNLLADRLKMTAHREKRPARVYELTVGKKGPKFSKAVPKEIPHDDVAPGKIKTDTDGFPILAGGSGMAAIPGHARIRSVNEPLSWFVRTLSAQLGCPVVDATGLQGNYDLVVSWAYGERAGETSGSLPLEPYLPSLMSAVESQLGLKLEQNKGEAEMLVVDHAEKTPTAN